MKGFEIFLLLHLGTCLAREVHVPVGPLYRVEGTPISISCNVSNYEGPSLQHFEWFVYRPRAPNISIGIISTKNPHFTYAVFESRRKIKDVYIHRVRGDSVELHIKRLLREDSGTYECYTPTTDKKDSGTYSDKVMVKVIPDLLQVSALKGRLASVSPPLLIMTESEELQLSCTASTQSKQHTHLSVSFDVSAPDTPVGPETLQRIIAVQRDFITEVGAMNLFADRYENGELHIEKAGYDHYKMAIGSVHPEDTGTYHCTAAEWIQDPDGSWQKITEKRSVLAQVNILSIDNQLKVLASPTEIHVNTGDTIEFFCNVTGIVSPLPAAIYSVEWEISSDQHPQGQLMAALTVDEAVILGEEYSNREIGNRHISLEKLKAWPGYYRLRIEAAQPGDLGTYRCIVKVFIRHSNLILQQVARQNSEGLKVFLKPEAVVLQASSRLALSSVYRGETAGLLCNITLETIQTVHVAVSWWVELAVDEQQEPKSHLIASVDREGVMELPKRVTGGEVSIDKLGPLLYKLRMHHLQQEDEGQYYCTATAWIQYPDQSWYSATSAKSKTVTVYPYARAMDLLFIPLIVGLASALFVGIIIIATVTCCFMRSTQQRKSVSSD